MSDQRAALPRNAKLLILGIVALGTAALAFRIPDVAFWRARDVLAWGGLVVASAVIEQFAIQLRHRTETLNFLLDDALWVGALLIAKPSVLTMAIVLGAVVGQRLQRWSLYKIAFNVGQFLVAITAAELVFRLFHATDPTTPAAWVAAAVGMFAYFVINVSSIALIISIVDERSFLSVVRPTLGLNVLHWAGNMAIGILGAVVYERAPIGLPLVVVPAILSYFAYRAWVQGMKERDRMRNLYEAGRALFAPLNAPQDLRSFVALVQQMLDSPAVEVVVVSEDDVTIHDAEGMVSLTPSPGEDGSRRSPEAYVRVRPGLSLNLSVIGARGEARGVLAAYRVQPFSDSERSLLDALASQVFVRFENLRLFSETTEQRTQLADIIAHTSDGIFVVSPDRRILSWNPAMERMTGMPATHAEGGRLEDVLGAEDAGTLASAARGSKPQVEVRDLPLVRSDGSSRWLRYTRNPVQDRDGELKAYVVVARDITADLETEQLKADFVATVSHELRTPLTPLKGFLSALLNGTVEDEPQARQEYYKIMLNQTSRLERLITDLLEVSRIESGKPVVEARPVELTGLIREHVKEYTGDEDGRIVTRMPDGDVLVQADPFRVGQVIANLISNALKYSPSDTPVEVTVRRDGEQAIISVKDRGEGIPLSEQDRVFERFHRVESGMTRRTGGTGLGLYIAKRLVEAMNGRLWLVSQPAEGSTFSFSLPLVEPGSLLAAGAAMSGDDTASANGRAATPDGRPALLP
ncbi:MAG: sensor histidine kinase [Actinomycetota bacterium]